MVLMAACSRRCRSPKRTDTCVIGSVSLKAPQPLQWESIRFAGSATLQKRCAGPVHEGSGPDKYADRSYAWGPWSSLPSPKMTSRKRLVGALLVAICVACVAFLGGYRSWQCSQWQDDYKRFLYVEVLKNTPVIYTREEIDRIIGGQPEGCVRPTSLTNEDVARYQREHVGPNEFLDEEREAVARVSR